MSLPIAFKTQSTPTQDGDGVHIQRIQDFRGQFFDPFLMVDELRSDDESDYIGGFPPHPHRGIETFTYIKKGGFEHRDHLGNREAIRAGGSQWMSTGYGVLHSEMPLADAKDGMHGFQIWINMAAKDKLRPARYQDSNSRVNPVLSNSSGAMLRPLAGRWSLDGSSGEASINELSAEAKIADLELSAFATANLGALERERVALLIYDGELENESLHQGSFVVLDKSASFELTLQAGHKGAGILIFAGTPLHEPIAHWGPFVMNTEEELQQAVDDYQAGRFGTLA